MTNLLIVESPIIKHMLGPGYIVPTVLTLLGQIYKKRTLREIISENWVMENFA